LDAPSGTAITLAEDIIHEIDRKKRWSLGKQDQESDLQINAFREGEVPGIHEIKYDSPVDYITIKHSAYSREGFALGAVLAAEYTASHTGFLSMSDLLKF
ncbi:MAG: 4-hydroxy-tetrahydrodipicolinate reductase, partial [Massilibacteroides sp.]|nr:4-hydroxy-tetrahydrodipicolinate reductase [Massilibacteroides sp.]